MSEERNSSPDSSWAAWGKLLTILTFAGVLIFAGYMVAPKAQIDPFNPAPLPVPGPYNPYNPYPTPTPEIWYRPSEQALNCLRQVRICDGINRNGQRWSWAVNIRGEYKYVRLSWSENSPNTFQELPPVPAMELMEVRPPQALPPTFGDPHPSGEPTPAKIEPIPDPKEPQASYRPFNAIDPRYAGVVLALLGAVPDERTQAAGLWGYAATQVYAPVKKVSAPIDAPKKIELIPTLPRIDKPTDPAEPIAPTADPGTVQTIPVKQEPPKVMNMQPPNVQGGFATYKGRQVQILSRGDTMSIVFYVGDSQTNQFQVWTRDLNSKAAVVPKQSQKISVPSQGVFYYYNSDGTPYQDGFQKTVVVHNGYTCTNGVCTKNTTVTKQVRRRWR